ncbi:MAG: hypothetical protein M1820_003878 [Bogoriella megaspora]|nr:MAG: hypothetical protein M1820_003878 [Bogoriella megaspora]
MNNVNYLQMKRNEQRGGADGAIGVAPPVGSTAHHREPPRGPRLGNAPTMASGLAAPSLRSIAPSTIARKRQTHGDLGYPPGKRLAGQFEQPGAAPSFVQPFTIGSTVAATTVYQVHLAKDHWVYGSQVKHNFEPGAVILAPYIDSLLNVKIQPGDAERAETSVGAACAKHRPYILVSKSDESFVAVALWTHQGTGIEKKSPESRAEHISVTKPGFPFQQQGPHRPLEVEQSSPWKVSPMCVARFTDFRTMSYSLPVKHLGYLTRESYIRLTDLLLDNFQASIKSGVTRMRKEMELEAKKAAATASIRTVHTLAKNSPAGPAASTVTYSVIAAR